MDRLFDYLDRIAQRLSTEDLEFVTRNNLPKKDDDKKRIAEGMSESGKQAEANKKKRSIHIYGD